MIYTPNKVNYLEFPEGFKKLSIRYGIGVGTDDTKVKLIFPSTFEEFSTDGSGSVRNGDITFKSINPPSRIDDIVNNYDSTVRIFVPAESVDAYKSAYSQFTNIIQAIPE